MKKALLAGESWMSYTTHVKGFDSFYTSVYETGEKYLKAALEEGGYEVTFLPNHLANEQFPYTMEELSQYDLVILSDIGANTLLLPTETFTRSIKKPNRCNLIKEYVEQGGASSWWAATSPSPAWTPRASGMTPLFRTCCLLRC